MDVFNTLIWTDAGHLPLVSHVLTSLEDRVCPIGFGGPPSTELQRVVDRLDLPRFDDLRQMIIQHEAAFLFLATAENVSKQDIIDALQSGMTVLALEPTAAELMRSLIPTNIAARKTPRWFTRPRFGEASAGVRLRIRWMSSEKRWQ